VAVFVAHAQAAELERRNWSGGTGLARQRCARPPSGGDPAVPSIPRPAEQYGAGCHVCARLRGTCGSRILCPRAVWRGACAGGHGPGARERPPQARSRRRSNHVGWLRSAPRPAACPGRLPTGGAWGPVCRGRWGSGRYGAPFCGWYALRVQASAGPVQLPGHAQSVEQHLVQALPHASLVPIAQPAPTGHARTAPPLGWQHLPRNAAAQHE